MVFYHRFGMFMQESKLETINYNFLHLQMMGMSCREGITFS